MSRDRRSEVLLIHKSSTYCQAYCAKENVCFERWDHERCRVCSQSYKRQHKPRACKRNGLPCATLTLVGSVIFQKSKVQCALDWVFRGGKVYIFVAEEFPSPNKRFGFPT